MLGKHKGGLGRKTLARAMQNVNGEKKPRAASTIVSGADSRAPEKVDDNG